MDPLSPEPSEKTAAPPPPTAPYLAGWIAVALVDAVVVAIELPSRTKAAARAAVHFRDAFQLVALGLVATLLAMLARRVASRRPRLVLLAAAALAGAIGAVVLREDFSGPAERMPGPVAVWGVALPIVVAQAAPLSAVLGGLLARRWVRLLGVAFGVALAALHAISYPRSYEGTHLLAAAVAATLIGASLRGAAFVDRVVPARPRVRMAIGAALAIPAAASILLTPRNDLAVLLAARPSVVIQPYLDRGSRPRARKPKPVVPRDQRAWFTKRTDLPPIPPTAPSLLPDKPIVLLIGIDSLRADVLADEKNRKALPTLFRLRDQGTYFTMARSAGSSTAPSMAAIFMSKSYSELYWTKIPGNRYTIPFPHKDPTPRFPEILSRLGVTTFTVDGAGWLQNELTIVRGFREEVELAPNRRYIHSRGIISEVVKRLDGPMDTPFFGFFHFLDAHFPYTSSGKKGTPYLSYLSALGAVDSQIDRLIRKLEDKGLSGRTTLIVMADHGEAFGEHGLKYHASSLYDELLRVPLLVVLPGGRAQKVDEPVSLMDLAPTILDLMGAPTPGVYMGQSLTPFLRGERPTLLRPIVAEGRLKRAIVLRDGFKVIHDTRAGYVEVFDLNADPREEVSLYDDDARAIVRRYGVLHAYFEANTFKKKGYKVPYRKW